MCRERRSDEEGLALITSLLAILILMGLSVVFVAAARNATAQSGISRDHERGVHGAEAAVDDVISRVNREDPDDPSTMYVTQWVDPDDSTLKDVVLSLDAGQTEEEWAIEVADNVPASAVIALPGTEVVGIRPENTAGNPLDVIFGVSYVPNRADAQRTRVVKVRYQGRLFDPSFALQTGPKCGGGSGTGLHVQGNGKILDGDPNAEPPANVHSNGNVTANIQSSNTTAIQGRVTAVGTVDASLDSRADNGAAGGQPCQPIPPITPRDLYRRSADETFWTGGTDGRWDLCYEGTVAYARLPAATGLPCSNTTGQIDLTSVGQFRGWTFDPNKKLWTANAVQNGIFYIYQASAHIKGSASGGPQPVTVLLESIGTDTSGSGTSCSGNSNTGNLCLTGTPKLVPALKDTAFVVSRDIDFAGNTGTTIGGFVTAGEQIAATGSVALTGAMLAQDNPHTPGSIVAKNIISGNLTLTFDADLRPPIDSVVQITAWNEL